MPTETETLHLCACPDCVRVQTDLMALIERYETALTQIGGLARSNQELMPGDVYGAGVMDGRRYAAQIAQTALDPARLAKEGEAQA